jgi:hypothetical protein
MADLDDRLESFDELPITYNTADDLRQADRAASLDDVTTYIYDSLIDYQGKWEKSDAHAWAFRFPYARYLAVNDQITNVTLDPDEVYTIAEILDETTNTVRLSGTTLPTTGDRLVLDDQNMVNFISAYPLEHADPATWRDTITYKVLRREPGTIQAHPFDARKEIKPRIRQIIPDPDNPNHHMSVWAQWFDNVIRFEFWTTTANGGDSLVSWFEDFLYKYTWVWKKNGVQEILYWRRAIDDEVTKWRDDLNYRSLEYYFRTEKIVPVRTHDISQIDLYVGLSSEVAPAASGIIPASGITEVMDGGLVT